MTSFLAEWAQAVWVVLCQSGPYLIGGFALAGLLKVLVPEWWIFRHMGGNDFKSVTVAACCGVPIPLCSCSVIPTAIALRKGGASKGATTSFMISTPETGVDSIGVTWALLDPIMTIGRPLAALINALTAGQLVNLLVRRGWDREPAAPPPAPVACAPADACCDPAPAAAEFGVPERIPVQPRADDHGHDHGHGEPKQPAGSVPRRALRYAFITLMDDLTPWFILGFVLSGLITVLVPDDFFQGALSPGLPTMLLMLAVAMPMYICATASTPVAAALIAKGLDPGAALVLLLAGPATSVATMLVVRRFLGGRVLVVYLATVATCSLLFGLAANALYDALDIDLRSAVAASLEELSAVTIAGGVALVLLMAASAWRLSLGARFGARLRGWCAPLGFDPTSRTAKIAGGLLLLALWLSTGVSVVGAGETGFLMRFGRVRETISTPALRVHAPYPLERMEIVRHDAVGSVEIGRGEPEQAPRRTLFGGPPVAAANEVLTGDEYLMRVEFAVHYRASDPYRARFGQGDAEALLAAFAESALRQVFARHTSDEVMVGHWQEMEGAVRDLLQAELDQAGAGLSVAAVQLLYLCAQDEVHEAFRDVASALEDKQRRIRRAERYRVERLAEARAEAYRVVQEAEGEHATAVQRARGDVAAFASLLQAHSGDQEVHRMRLRLDAARQSLQGARLILKLTDAAEVILLGKAAPPAAQAPPPGAEDH